jgi:hypothetical protein
MTAEPEAVQALNVILRRTKARVVIASDRAVLGRRRIEELLVRSGVTATLHDDWRTTPLSSSTRAVGVGWRCAERADPSSSSLVRLESEPTFGVGKAWALATGRRS